MIRLTAAAGALRKLLGASTPRWTQAPRNAPKGLEKRLLMLHEMVAEMRVILLATMGGD